MQQNDTTDRKLIFAAGLGFMLTEVAKEDSKVVVTVGIALGGCADMSHVRSQVCRNQEGPAYPGF